MYHHLIPRKTEKDVWDMTLRVQNQHYVFVKTSEGLEAANDASPAIKNETREKTACHHSLINVVKLKQYSVSY